MEMDKLKHVFRQSRLLNYERHENSAEHSWHLAVIAMILSEYAEEELDILKVLKMVLIHDIVEIDAGDTLHMMKQDMTIKNKGKSGCGANI